MSVFPASDGGRTCGCLGCSKPADAVIDYPQLGERVVCEEHADNHEVVRDV